MQVEQCLGGRSTFSHVSFQGCSLLVLSGAHTTLQDPGFTTEGPGISLFLHGAGTSITGGTQGVSVQASASLEASDLTVTATTVSLP